MAAPAVQVDDSDPRIVYGGTWAEEGSSSEYMQCVPLYLLCAVHSCTARTGRSMLRRRTARRSPSSSTVRYPYHSAHNPLTHIRESGTGIAVFGTAVPQNSNLTPFILCTIDDATGVNITLPQPATKLFKQAFYTSPPLADGTHTLLVTAGGLDGATHKFWFDYLAYTPGAASTSSSVGTASGAAETGAAASHHSSSNARVVVPAVLVPLIVLALLGALLFFFLRQRSLRRRAPSSVHRESKDTIPTLEVNRESHSASLRKILPTRVFR